jgi:hypothetical protein
MFPKRRANFPFALFFVLCAASAVAQTDRAPATAVAGIPVNYDEALVGSYALPEPLVLANGKPVRDARTWTKTRRAEIVRLFEENQNGRAPGRPSGMSFDVWDKATPAFDGRAVRRQRVLASQARAFGRIDVVPLLEAGFGFATVYYGMRTKGSVR